MKRIDEVYKKLKEMSKNKGISAAEIADALGLERANVSKDLNRISDDGKAIKIKGKPVLFKATNHSKRENEGTVLDKFVAKNESMHFAAKQAKAAVLYPPDGMHILILGETGVGKSMFSALLHKYAIEMKRMNNNSPFIIFNCADYANNPQLLISQLFGSKKGAYTGADSEKVGLIEKANGGILFLDEVHRLPSEGQEMFFTFMDKGIFRRLGETEQERKSNVLIICATTEDPESTLLKTFTRRIPMVIRIPKLSERSIEERFNLISWFFREESARLDKEIKVSMNSMRAFLSYNCLNNVGQLKTDIQLACARAYAEFLSLDEKEIVISSLELPQYIKQGLYKETEHRQLWNKLIGISKRYIVFNELKENILYDGEENDVNIYEMIDNRVHELRSRGITSDELEKEMGRDIEEYFKSYMHNVNKDVDMSSLENIIDQEIIGVAREIIKFSEESLKRRLSERVYLGIVVHISNSIERRRRNKKIINPQLNQIRTEHSMEFDIALECIKIIDRTLDISMPIDEAGFLAMFFAYDEKDVEDFNKYIKVIVIAHGASTATSMAETANRLLGVKYAIGINAPIEEKAEQVITNIKNYLSNFEMNSDILFLVDMGSLTTFGEEIEDELGINIKTRTIPLVSTLHVIEATRKAVMGYTLEEVYRDVINVNTLMQDVVYQEEVEDVAEKLAIVTVCTTGEGSAVAIRNMIYEKIQFDSSIFEIIPINLIGKESIYNKLRNIEKKYHIVCIVSSFSFDTKIPQFKLQDILCGKAISDIQKLVDMESTYLKMGDTLENNLNSIDVEECLKYVKKFINKIEEKIDTRIDTNILIGVAFHLCYMIDRIKSGNTLNEEFEVKDEFTIKNNKLYEIVKDTVKILEIKYEITIPEDEICYIMTFFSEKMFE